MGATVTTGKRAGAFTAPSGKVIYVLFEETYDKNCYPHTPDWNCTAIGRIPTVLKRIFEYAAVCEGGMLQGRGGDITPEGYIRGWLKELAAPIDVPDRTIRLKIGKGESIAEGEVEKVKQSLLEIGRTDILNALMAGEVVDLQLHKDVDVIIALYGPGAGKMSPWRAIKRYADGIRNKGLGYVPTLAKSFDIQIPTVLRVGGDDRLLQRADGSWYCAGWAYSIVGNFIKKLWKSELDEPGSYNKCIRAYRETVTTAPLIPLDGIKVIVDKAKMVSLEGDHGHYARLGFEEFAKAYSVTDIGLGFEIYPTSDNLYRLSQMPTECTTWFPQDRDTDKGTGQLTLLTA
jgi:hypothetical protein